jgi:hypothetical protein
MGGNEGFLSAAHLSKRVSTSAIPCACVSLPGAANRPAPETMSYGDSTCISRSTDTAGSVEAASSP